MRGRDTSELSLEDGVGAHRDPARGRAREREGQAQGALVSVVVLECALREELVYALGDGGAERLEFGAWAPRTS